MAASEDPLSVKYSSSLLNSEILIQNNGALLDNETKDVDIESISEKVTFTCQPCKKVYLTKGGFNRHVRRVHQTVHVKLTDDELQFLHCFESEDTSDQVIVDLLDRGGLRGIKTTTKNIFTRTEYEFRWHTKRNIQNIDILEITKILLNDLDVTGNMFTATDSISNVKEEIVSNVVESMLIVYLRVRSFSYVRDISTQKKMEKNAELKEKALRKTLKKKNEKSKKLEE